MTTVIYNPEEGKMVSDGQASIGTTITSMNTKKVFKVNGCLVGFAGRLSSAMKFLSWIEQWMVANTVQYDFPEVAVQIPENMVEDDFIAIVADPTNKLFIFEGGNAFYEIDNKPTAIGSGDVYALSALDAGCTAEEAIKIAIGRDCMSGGEIFSEEFDAHEEPLDREAAEKMSHEELVSYFFPVEIGEESCDEDALEESVDMLGVVKEKFPYVKDLYFDRGLKELGLVIRDGIVLYEDSYVAEYDTHLLSDNVEENPVEILREVCRDFGIEYSKSHNRKKLAAKIREVVEPMCEFLKELNEDYAGGETN